MSFHLLCIYLWNAFSVPDLFPGAGDAVVTQVEGWPYFVTRAEDKHPACLTPRKNAAF